ncbi:MAG: hypothetical protein L6420_04045 [Elusimicrobia bacterium]|nr:hypothetical protein [Nanoarchaeota archaeon]MCG2725423.1 hypothetical protein [Elusimicrobiota bacterium]
MLTEKEILLQLTSKRNIYAPLKIDSIEQMPKRALAAYYKEDVQVTIFFQNRKAIFSAVITTRTAPKIVEGALWRIKRTSDSYSENILLVVPYLSPDIVELLNREKVSGIDLNGNYLIQVTGIAAMCLDRKNNFVESQSIKNVYAGNSSLVGRLLLTRGQGFRSANEILSSIKQRGGALTQSTVSKVLKGLEEDLIIEKRSREIFLLQPKKLLKKLLENYRSPVITEKLKLKLPNMENLNGLRIVDDFKNSLSEVKWVISGDSSARRYSVMADDSLLRIYMTDYSSLIAYEDDRFYNVVAQKTASSFLYFDTREENGLNWASPIQSWIELNRLGKREREIADGVFKSIIGRENDIER